MRVVFLVCAAVRLGLAGCGLFEQESEQVQRTGHGVNLLPTERETRAGAD